LAFTAGVWGAIKKGEKKNVGRPANRQASSVFRMKRIWGVDNDTHSFEGEVGRKAWISFRNFLQATPPWGRKECKTLKKNFQASTGRPTFYQSSKGGAKQRGGGPGSAEAAKKVYCRAFRQKQKNSRGGKGKEQRKSMTEKRTVRRKGKKKRGRKETGASNCVKILAVLAGKGIGRKNGGEFERQTVCRKTVGEGVWRVGKKGEKSGGLEGPGYQKFPTMERVFP